MAAISIADVDSALKVHYKKNPEIYQAKMIETQEIFANSGITIMNDVEDEAPMYKLTTSDPGQPGNRGTEAPKSNVLAFSNRTVKVRDAEITVKFTQQEINALYRTHLRQIREAGARRTAYDIPFEDVLFSALVDKWMHHIVTDLSWGGVYNASGDTTAAIANGWETVIDAAVTATDIVAATQQFTGSALTNANALVQFDGVNALITDNNPEYEGKELVTYCSHSALKKYRTNYRATHSSLPYNTEFKKNFLDDDTNRPIAPMQGLAGSDRIVTTTPGNLVIATDSLTRLGNFWTEARGRDLIFYVDGKIGFDFIMAEEIWQNNL
jgi:hypothetical protein